MEVDVLQENLAKATTLLSRTTPKCSQLPILEHLFIETDKGRLAISASDLELYATIHIGAQVKQEGAITLPAKMLATMVSKLPNERTTLSVKEKTATITQDSRELSIQGYDADDFPPPPKHGEITGTLNAEDFLATLARVSFCAATDERRPAIQGIHMKAEGDQLTLTATDGFRLANFRMAYNGKPFTTIIPGSSLAKFVKLLKAMLDDRDDLHVAETELSLHLVHDNLSVTMQPIQGTFPDCTTLIPDSYESRITVARDDLLAELGICMALVKGSREIIRLTAAGSELAMSAKAEEEGVYQAKLAAKLEGEPTKIAFNGTLLTGILHAMTEDIVTLDLGGPSKPGVLHDSDAGIYVLMPMVVTW